MGETTMKATIIWQICCRSRVGGQDMATYTDTAYRDRDAALEATRRLRNDEFWHAPGEQWYVRKVTVY